MAVTMDYQMKSGCGKKVHLDCLLLLFPVFHLTGNARLSNLEQISLGIYALTSLKQMPRRGQREKYS